MARTGNGPLWHPFADMAAVAGNEFRIDRAEGVWVYDETGRRYLDASASLWCSNIGHGRAEVADAVAAQIRKLDSYSIFGDLTNEPAEQLAVRLAALAPLADPKIMLTCGGGEAIETAAKLARAHWVLRGRPEKSILLSRETAYHGSHGFGTSVGGVSAFRAGWGPLMPDASNIERDDAESLAAEIREVGADRIAAFFCEPVMGAGGVRPPAPGYVERVAEICREADILLVVDAVICAFGRLGTWFGVERFGVEPDIIAFAKGVSGGYAPVGGVVVSAELAAPYWEQPGTAVFHHGVTYAGHPACSAAALAVLDIYEREGLISRGQELEEPLHNALRRFSDHPLVGDVRGGLGLLGALELHPSLLAERPSAPRDLQRHIREAGVLVRALSSAIAVSPPLTFCDDDMELMSAGIAAGLEAFARDPDVATWQVAAG